MESSPPNATRAGGWRWRPRLPKPRTLLATFAVALAAAGVGALLRSDHVLRRPEELVTDARYQLRGESRDETRGIVLVGIDTTTLTEFEDEHLSGHFPFPYSYYARVIERLGRAHARVIGLDLELPGETDRANESALLTALRRAGNVVLGTTEVGEYGEPGVLGGADVQTLRARGGDVQFPFDSDGVIRSTRYSVLGLKTFAVAIEETARRREVPSSMFGGSRGAVPIAFAGPGGSFPAISFSSVYNGTFSPGEFAGKIVIVGAAAPTLHDNLETPLGEMAGSELLANAVATVRAGNPLRAPGTWVTIILIVGLPLLIAMLATQFGTLGVALSGLVVLGLWALATELAFQHGRLLDFSDPAAALALATGALVLLRLAGDRRERHELRMQFAAAQSAVVAEVLHDAHTRRLEPTGVIAGYRIEEEIGRGGMGVVYRATQLALKRTVALKLIAAERAQDPVFRERFKRESLIAASIDHASVVPVYEAGEDEGLLFIAMRRIDGSDLELLLARGGPLDPSRTSRILNQVAGALDAAHARGLVHRDMKPANILVTREEPEHAYLTDFGIAKEAGGITGVTASGQLLGTLAYLAPEQVRSEEVGSAADIYALTGVLYHCLTGSIPFPGKSDAATMWAHVSASPPRPSIIRPDLPPEVDEVVAHGMDKDPQRRFATASQLAQSFAASLGIAPDDGSALALTRSAARDQPQPGPTIIAE